MGRFTQAYTNFLDRLPEIERLRTIARDKEKRDPVGLRDEINALCRGAVVLLSSHVEAYIKEIGEVALDRIFARQVSRTNLNGKLFYHISKDLIDEIKDTADPEKMAAKIFDFVSNDGPFWSRVGPFASPIPADRFNKGFSNPAFDKVRAYFNRFGYLNYRTDFYQTLGADAQATENMLNHLVATRNNIAHGDAGATKTPSDIRDMTKFITQFCRVTDTIFADWSKNTHCSIR